MTPPDEITLTIPRDRALYGVADLVLGGLGIRLNLTIEHLEDLQLALETALDRVRADPVTETRSACAASSTRLSIVLSSKRRTAATG